MIYSRRSIFIGMLVALPLLAATTILFQKHSQQAASALPQPVPVEAPELPSVAMLAAMHYSLRGWKPSAAQKAVLKLKRKKMGTLPTRITAVRAAIPAVNTAYTLAVGFDPNGLQYYQNKEKTQFCQWSTYNYCWCLRDSVIAESPGAAQSAEYISSRGQTYQKGPAGEYRFGGEFIGTYHATAPVVSAVAAN